MSKNVRCSECIHQMTGWDGGFFGEPVTFECKKCKHLVLARKW